MVALACLSDRSLPLDRFHAPHFWYIAIQVREISEEFSECCKRRNRGLSLKANMSKKLKSVHPGEVLREEFLLPVGMSVNQLALALRISTPRLNLIVRGISAVTPNTALRLARYLNTTPDFWLNLQLQYDLDIAEDREGPAIEREVFPRKSAHKQSPEV
jgi:addiction module HigA family antidote